MTQRDVAPIKTWLLAGDHMTRRSFRVTSVTHPVERISVETDLPFAVLTEAFEAELGRYDRDVGARLASTHASWDDVSAAIGAMAGPHGLMIMSRLALGLTASLYLIGNPLIASETADVRAGMLAPFRVEISATEAGAMLSYDRPSSSLASLRTHALTLLGLALDGRMDNLVAALGSAAPPSR